LSNCGGAGVPKKYKRASTSGQYYDEIKARLLGTSRERGILGETTDGAADKSGSWANVNKKRLLGGQRTKVEGANSLSAKSSGLNPNRDKENSKRKTGSRG